MNQKSAPEGASGKSFLDILSAPLLPLRLRLQYITRQSRHKDQINFDGRRFRRSQCRETCGDGAWSLCFTALARVQAVGSDRCDALKRLNKLAVAALIH